MKNTPTTRKTMVYVSLVFYAIAIGTALCAKFSFHHWNSEDPGVFIVAIVGVLNWAFLALSLERHQ